VSDTKPGPSVESSQKRAALADSAQASGFLAGGNFFELASRALIALLLARWLGVEGYGLYVLAVSAASLFTGVSLLGLDRAMIRYVAIQSRRHDRAGLLGTMRFGVLVASIAGAVLGVALYFASDLVAEGLFHEPALVPLLEVTAVLVPFLTVSSVLIGIAQGFNRMDYSALAENVIQTVVRLGLLAVLVSIDSLDVFAAVVIFGVADVAATITLILLLRRDWVRDFPGPAPEPPRTDRGEILRFAFPLWLSGLLRKFRNNIETFLLGSLNAVSTVGIYSVVGKINLVGHVSYLAILGGVRPTLASLHDSGEREALSAVYTTATRWTMAVNLPFFIIIVLFPAELLGIFGEDFTAGASALMVLAVAELINAGTGVCQSMIDMTGHTGVKLINSFLWMALAVGMGFLLIPELGVLGAALSSLIAVGVVNILSVIQVWVLEKLNPFDRRYLKPIAAGLASLVLALLARYLMRSAGDYLTLIVVSSLIGVVYVASLVALGIEDDDRRILGGAARRIRKVLRLKQRTRDEGPRAEVRG
jgi:O-antigen/teichoic acid export membrane protein